MTNYIVRCNGVGPKSCPAIAELAGMKVVNVSEESLPADAEMIFRWGTITSLPNGPKVVNKKSALETSGDKRGFRITLSDAGLAPKTFGSLDDLLINSPQWPSGALLVRPAHHKRSEGMYLCKSPQELLKAIKDIDGRYYISEFVNKQKEFRVFVAQNRVVWMIEKHPKSADEISWGCVEDGNFDYVGWSEWPKKVVKVALESMKLSGLDFGAVDILVDEDGRALVTEINTAPWLSPYYIKCIAKVFSYIVKNGRDHFPDTENLDWQSVIHPAIGG